MLIVYVINNKGISPWIISFIPILYIVFATNTTRIFQKLHLVAFSEYSLYNIDIELTAKEDGL